MSVKSYLTAISRRTPSAPLTQLEKMGLIRGKVLDYGCGRGSDGEYLKSKSIFTDSYDPHWSPISLKDNKYDTILCTYVLNVLKKEDEADIISNIQRHLNPNGKAYISVRRDVKQDGPTSRGYQRNVTLNFPVIKEKKSNYCIYELCRL
jgi:cyclopropane fatty-acyl-phospholipid synthase-like methyltransferase